MQGRSFLGLALAAGLLAGGAPAAAQTDGPKTFASDSVHGRRMDPISRILDRRDELKLTDEQVRQLTDIQTKYREKHKGQREEMRRKRQQRSAFRASMDSARAEVSAVLTPEQQEKVKAMREEWRREWREAHRGRHHERGKREKEDGKRDG